MRFIICLCLLIGCNTHTSIPVGGTVSEGTFISLGPNGDVGGRIALMYLDIQGAVSMDEYCVRAAGIYGMNAYSERLVVFGNQTLSPGDRFKVVVSEPVIVNGDTLPVYTITKLE